MRVAPIPLFLVLLCRIPHNDAFVVVNPNRSNNHRQTSPTRHSATSRHNTDDTPSPQPLSTRRSAIATSATVLATLLTLPPPSLASVTVDPDRYGDKELKMATVNVVKGRVRDVLTSNPPLVSPFLQIAMYDALTYDSSTGSGGPDGGIVPLILTDDPPKALAGLVPAAKELEKLRKSLLRTTEITMADVVALAGAEAIETAGGPRLVVQLGKGEPKGSPRAGGVSGGAQSSLVDLSGGASSADAIAAFRRAGLTERDVTLFYGLKFAMEKVVDDLVVVQEEEQEVNEMGETEVSFPSSFGGSKEKYGKPIGKLDKAIFASIMARVKKKDAGVPSVFYDPSVAECAQAYASKKADYVKDLKLAYGSWMSLGAQYTGGGILLFDSNY